MTRQRVAILDVLQDAQPLHEHLTVAAIAQRARPLAVSMSLQTAYDCLDALTEACLLRAIEPAGHPVRYEARVADGHHHLVCRRCGELTDVDDVGALSQCDRPIQERMVWHWFMAEDELGQRVVPAKRIDMTS